MEDDSEIDNGRSGMTGHFAFEKATVQGCAFQSISKIKR
jgi:hypothetical protein